MFAPLLFALLATAPAPPPAQPQPCDVTAPAAEPVTRWELVDGPVLTLDELEDAMPAAAQRLREVRSDTLIAVRPGMALEIHNLAGTIAVEAWPRGEVHVTSEHARRDRVDAHVENGVLVINVVNPRGEAAFGDIRVSVPAWLPLRLSSIESAINVAGMRAAIEAGSVRGDVCVRGIRGAMQLRSVEGGVRVVDARGRMHVASINKAVRLERVMGLIDAESVNGDIEMAQVESPDVDASSVNGSVAFDGPFQPRGRYRLVSHNGNLRVGVPVGADVDVSVSAFRGGFESGIPVLIGPHGKGRRFTFTLGGGGSSLELQSFQGLIQLLRSEGLPVPPRAPTAPVAPATPQEDR